MTGHIRERSPGSFEIRYSLGTDPATGRRKIATATVRGGRKDAERELRRLLRAVDTGEHSSDPERMTVGDWFEKWLAAVRAEVSPATHARYTAMVDNYLRPAWGAMRLSKFAPAHIQDTYAQWGDGGRRDGRTGPLAASTRRLLHRVLTASLNRAVELQLITRNPAVVLRRRLPKLERAEMRTLTPEQSRGLLDELRGSPQYWPVMLALATGARRGEVLALRWKHVDTERGTLRIAESVSPELRFGPTKSGKPRSVSLPAVAVQELCQRRREQAEELLRLGVRQEPETLVCTWPDGSLIGPESLSNFCDRLFQRLGLPGRFHVLRHTHATQLLLAGVHPKVAQERLGHATVAMTLDIYSHVTEKQHDDAADRIDEVLRGAR
jgi:integrase